MSESTQQVNEMCQIIYYDFTINQTIDKHLAKTGFNKLGKDYNTLAIIGAQSSGKSTLLNKLFDTNFAVMSTTVGRGQTTKGVWMASHQEAKVLILDCEGTDSKERGEDRHKFEHSSSLFCLAVADVLIINMWTNDVGRYTASNYGVLKIVFEMNLKLFQQECAKKILIVLRDFDPKRNIKSKIEELILNDINNLWNDIQKPEKYQDTRPSQFFEFEFITLSHKKYCENEFEEDVKELRKRLDTSNPQYIFSHIAAEKNVPSDGIKQYFHQIWDDILSEKDLNIPSQKEMLANYRCNEIKEGVLADYANDIKELVNLSSTKNIPDFKRQTDDIVRKILEDYDKIASNYLDRIYLNVRTQIVSYLSQNFYIAFSNQANRIIPISQKFMRQELQKELKTNENFYSVAIKVKNKFMNDLFNKLSDKKSFEDWQIPVDEYSELFDAIIDDQRKQSLEERRIQNTKTLKKELEEFILAKLENFTGNFWVEFNHCYFECLFNKLGPLKIYLSDYYKMDNAEFTEYAKTIENDIYNSIKKDFDKKTKEIASIGIELFRKKFWYEKETEPRIWNKLEDEQIDNLFKKYRLELSDLFEVLKYFKVPKSPLKFVNYEVDNSEDVRIVIEKIPKIIENESELFESLLKQNEITTMRRKFEEGISNMLEDAKRRKAGLFNGGLPWYAWVLIIFFGFDDFLRLLQSFWIFPILILVGAYFTLHSLNLTYPLRNFYYDAEDFIAKKKKIIFK